MADLSKKESLSIFGKPYYLFTDELSNLVLQISFWLYALVSPPLLVCFLSWAWSMHYDLSSGPAPMHHDAFGNWGSGCLNIPRCCGWGLATLTVFGRDLLPANPAWLCPQFNSPSLWSQNCSPGSWVQVAEERDSSLPCIQCDRTAWCPLMAWKDPV